MKLAAFIAYAAFMAWVSLSPAPPPAAEWLQLWDKALHCSLYAIFVLLGCQLIRHVRALAWLALAIFGYGAALELGQSFVPGRDMSALDMVANGLGVAIGSGAALRFTDTFRKTAEP